MCRSNLVLKILAVRLPRNETDNGKLDAEMLHLFSFRRQRTITRFSQTMGNSILNKITEEEKTMTALNLLFSYDHAIFWYGLIILDRDDDWIVSLKLSKLINNHIIVTNSMLANGSADQDRLLNLSLLVLLPLKWYISHGRRKMVKVFGGP